jgi:3-phosphoshikimate 1-carboxyvinyltransferase
MTKRFVVRPSGPLRGKARVPGDKSIGHRALLFGALAEGRSLVRGLSGGLDNASTANAFAKMGVRYEMSGDAAHIDGVGLEGLKMPDGHLDCGNSGTTMRLIAGVLAAQKFGTRLVGDASLTRRPMRRVVDPLRARGAHIAGQRGRTEGEHYPPLSVAPLVDGERLTAIEVRTEVASAQVKSALLLSGLWAEGPTAVAEPTLSRDHTERMLVALGAPLEAFGSMCVLDPTRWEKRRLPAFEWTVPGDLSSAAFLLAAAAMVPGSEIELEGVGVNPTRTGFLDALRSMRAGVEVVPRGDAAGNEPVASLHARHGSLAPTRIGGELIARMIDEVPVFAALATCAGGRTEVRDAQELRVKESDRLKTMADVLRAFGGDVVELEDGLTIHGGRALKAAHVESHGDHRIAMSAVVLGLVAEGETRVDDVECVDTSFPGFAALLRSLGADVREETVAEEKC